MSNPTHPRKRTIQQGRELIIAWKNSGLPASAFARSQGVHPKRLDFWQRRLRQLDLVAVPDAGCSGFIRIEEVEPAPVAQVAQPPPVIEALLPNGIRLAIHADTALPRLVAVVAALSGLVVAC